jgi:hypothetical protein
MAINLTDGHLPAASTMVGIVVTSSNSIIRGFVNATYEPNFERCFLLALPRFPSLCPNKRELIREGTMG